MSFMDKAKDLANDLKEKAEDAVDKVKDKFDGDDAADAAEGAADSASAPRRVARCSHLRWPTPATARSRRS